MNGLATWVITADKALFWCENGELQYTSFDDYGMDHPNMHPSHAVPDGVHMLSGDVQITRDEALALFDMHMAARAVERMP